MARRIALAVVGVGLALTLAGLLMESGPAPGPDSGPVSADQGMAPDSGPARPWLDTEQAAQALEALRAARQAPAPGPAGWRTLRAVAAMDGAAAAWQAAASWATATSDSAVADEARGRAAHWRRLAAAARRGRPATAAEFRDALGDASVAWGIVMIQAEVAGNLEAADEAEAEKDRWFAINFAAIFKRPGAPAGAVGP